MTLLYLKQYGNVFEVRLATDVPSNAWQGSVVLPADIRVQNVVYGQSIGDIWQTPPTFLDQEIIFVGGRTAPWTGDGLLFRFMAAPKSAANTPAVELIRFASERTAVYSADGKGTALPMALQPITVNSKDLLSATTSLPILPGDVPPEAFSIIKVRDPGIFDGKLAIVFSTTDAGVGIDHYEAQEHTRHGVIGWHVAESPYLVDPEATKILIRAIDRNGNFRVESIVLREGLSGGLVIVLVVVSVLACLFAAYSIKKWRRKNTR